MPTEIYLVNETAEPEYETIPEDEVLDTDTVVEHIHEDAKMEEKENENGEKEMVEVSPASDKAKIVNARYRSVIRHRCGQSIQTNAAKKIILISTGKYLWITKNLCSGFI